jgi:ribonuclease HII
MFVAGVSIAEERLKSLESLGLKDSKKLSDQRRKELGPRVKDAVDAFHVKEVTANQIDELRQIMSLNVIELKAFAEALTELHPDRAIVDLPEPDGERFGRKIRQEMGDEWKELAITAEHGADDRYPIVSAASILAKNARERHVAELKQKYDYDFKSGYPHDKPTIEFLKQYLETNGELPPETRLSWSTAERILKESQQKGIGDF